MALGSYLERTRFAIPVRAIRAGAVVCAAMLAVAGVSAVPASGQTPATPTPSGSAASSSFHGSAASPANAVRPAHAPKHSRKAKSTPAPALAATPQPPPLPDWPVNDKAQPPSVSWNGRDLTIAATNSSLQTILNDVSTATGVKVEGADNDQRIFGSYGPASAREVLSQLLEGSGYNVLIIGDKGEGTPRELVLSARVHISGSSAANSPSRSTADDDTPEEPEAPEPGNPMQHRPFGVQPGQGRSPEQLQEEQQRMQQLQQQQQQPPQPNPQPPNE